MRKRSIPVCLIFIFIFLCTAACTVRDNTDNSTEPAAEEEFVPKSLMYPPMASVFIGNKKLVLSAYEVSWAYALNEKEWCSVKTEEPIQPIDQDYASYLETTAENGTITVSFPSAMAPDEVGYIHRYDSSLWLPGENDEDLRIKEKIERQRDYEDFTELPMIVDRKEGYKVLIDTSVYGSGVYDIEFAWERGEYRGLAKYSFLIVNE